VGRNADIFDPEAGRLLRAGSKLIFPSAHLHSTGALTKAHLELGFKFHPKGYQPTKKVKGVDVTATLDLDIKGMQADQRIEAYSTLTENTKMTVFEPHMHAAGVRMCLDAIWGTTVQTLSCAGYNHSWVRTYMQRPSCRKAPSCASPAISITRQPTRTSPIRETGRDWATVRSTTC
jgi:hypothetical protein